MNKTESAGSPRVSRPQPTKQNRRKVKRMVEMAKSLRGIRGKIPRGRLPALKATATQQEKERRSALESKRLTLDTVRFFLEPSTRTSDV